MNEVMTEFGEIATRVEERITSAPVADWLKDEARADLTRLVSAHAAQVQALSEVKYDETTTPEQAAPDYSWRRMQIVEAILRLPVAFENRTGEHIVSQAKIIEAYVNDGS